MDSVMNNFENYKLAKGSGRELLISAASIPDACSESDYDGVASKIHTTPDIIRHRSSRSTSRKTGSEEQTYDLNAEYDTLVELCRKQAHTTFKHVLLDRDFPANESKLICEDLDDGSILCRTRRGKLTFLPVKIKIAKISDDVVKKVLEPTSSAKITSNPFYESMYKECAIKSTNAAEVLDRKKATTELTPQIVEISKAPTQEQSQDFSSSDSSSVESIPEELVELFDLEESLGPDNLTEPTKQAALPSVPDLFSFSEPCADLSSTIIPSSEFAQQEDIQQVDWSDEQLDLNYVQANLNGENLNNDLVDLDVLDMGLDLDYNEFL